MAKKKDDMIEVYIPLDRSNEKNVNYYCSVNGVAMLVPMGKRVKVPAAYAYAIMNAQSDKRIAEEKKELEEREKMFDD